MYQPCNFFRFSHSRQFLGTVWSKSSKQQICDLCFKVQLLNSALIGASKWMGILEWRFFSGRLCKCSAISPLPSVSNESRSCLKDNFNKFTFKRHNFNNFTFKRHNFKELVILVVVIIIVKQTSPIDTSQHFSCNFFRIFFPQHAVVTSSRYLDGDRVTVNPCLCASV